MGSAPALGAAVTVLDVRSVLLGFLIVLLSAFPGLAAERFVLVVAGAAGSPKVHQDHARWVDTLEKALVGPFGIPADHVIVLRDAPADDAGAATAEHVKAAIGRLRERLDRDDMFCVVLIGHGTYDGVDAKFNLVGPDLEAADWKRLLDTLPGQQVVINTAGASFPFLQRLAAQRRVVVTATGSPAQRYDTVFPQFFVASLEDPEADLDKDGRVSIGEAFTYASTRTRRWYEQRGQLPTERALLDDNGDGSGKEAGVPGPDGSVASRLFQDAGPEAGRSSDPALSELIARRDAIEGAIEELKRKRTFMPPGDYEKELERLLIDMARVSRQVRARS